jgi:hypothetical protein
VADPLGFIERLARLAKHGGRIGISVPDQRGPIRLIDPCIMNMPPHHATRWNLSALRAAGEKLNLKLQRVAYEPLLLENHSYYSVYWVHHVLCKESITWRILCRLVSFVLRAMFELLRLSGMKRLSWLKGQSIYVLFVREEARPAEGQ